MDKTTMEKKLRERIAVEGRQSIYNPLLQKPTMLNPVGPGSYPGGLGGYAYIGPPPDFGGSYGSYEDAGGRKQAGIKASKMFSIHDGSPTQLYAELSPEERQALVTQLEEASESHKCPACRSELMISMPAELESVHCPHCGTQLDDVAEKIKQCVSKLQEKNMSKAATTVVKADITQVVSDPAKDAKNALQPKEMGADVKPGKAAMIQPAEKAKTDNAMKELDGGLKAANEGKLKSEHNANGVQSGGIPVASSTEKQKRQARLQTALANYKSKKTPAAAKAEGSLELDAKTRIAAKREFRIMATFEPAKFEALKKNVKLAPLCAEVEKKLYTKEQRAAIRAELKALAADDAEAASEMKKKLEFVAPEILMEEDMEHGKHAHGSDEEKAQAEAAAKAALAGAPAPTGTVPGILATPAAAAPAAGAAPVKAEAEESEEEKAKKAKAAEEEEAEKAKAALAAAPAAAAAPVKADGGDMPPAMGAEGGAPAAAAAPMMTDDEKAKAEAEKAAAAGGHTHPGAAGEAGKAKAGEEGADGMAYAAKTEFLASLADLQGERVEMSLYGEETENPFWNLTVDSEPVGRIYLGDQQDPQSIRSSFMSDAYAENFGNAIGKVGVGKMLELSKARLYAHEVDEASVTARLREKAKTEAHAEMEEKLGTIRKDFISAMTVAMIATDKNYFQGEGAHELKGGLFNALVQAGLESGHAVAAIETGFQEAPAYWKFIMAKATELMDMPKEARESFEKNVLASGNIEIAVQPEAGSEEQQIMNRLVKSSVTTLANGGVVSGEDRKEIAARLGFAASRR